MLLYAALLAAHTAASAVQEKSIIVNDADANIEWVQSAPTNQTCETQDLGTTCDSTWWTGHQTSHLGGDAHFTFGPDTSLTFAFCGSSVGVFGVQLSWSGRGIASVDGGEEAIFDTRTPNEQNYYQVPFYTTDGLNPMQTHTLTVRYDPSQFQQDPESRVILGIDYVTYGVPDFATKSGMQSYARSLLRYTSEGLFCCPPDIGAIVGGILGGILGLTAAVALFIFWRRRRRSKSPRRNELRTADHPGRPRPWRGSMLPTSRAPGAAPESAVSPYRMEKKTQADPPPYTIEG
ncbi:hypothetical protein AURDEDRAFT_188536 [Auricularia subglabra TFB-10046 SS5]|uniref:Uncharacterized protein n=1 Tax=Auricularia subglabra (strain TFB-10046 / SS5) TaxID=717982 RepID=J0WSB0_AURST|nr:hypothetical protein AURDEDRAFT_188536 [Auricularia subglabra TFB-10046 SS5]